MIKIGIVGAGYIASSHAQAYSKLPASKAKLSVVVDQQSKKAEKLASKYGAAPLTSLDDLIKAGIDAISICTPTASHAEIAIAAMQAGIHVLCEKPLARTLNQADRMMKVSKQTGMILMPGHVTRFEAEHSKAKAVLQHGDLGKLCMATHTITTSFPDWNQNWYSKTEKSGGPILDLAIHSIDYLIWLFDNPPIRIYARGNKKSQDITTYANILMRFENGGIGLIETSWAHPHDQPLQLSAELIGTDGRLSWDYESITALRMISNQCGKRDFPLLGEDSFFEEIKTFINCIEQDRKPPISTEAGYEAIKVSLAAIKSIEQGQTINL